MAHQQYREHVLAMLEDPWCNVDITAVEAVSSLRQIGCELGLDFDQIVRELGTPYQVSVLCGVETGTMSGPVQ